MTYNVLSATLSLYTTSTLCYCICIEDTTTLLLLTMVYGLFSLFLFHFLTKIYAHFLSLETSMMELKL